CTWPRPAARFALEAVAQAELQGVHIDLIVPAWPIDERQSQFLAESDELVFEAAVPMFAELVFDAGAEQHPERHIARGRSADLRTLRAAAQVHTGARLRRCPAHLTHDQSSLAIAKPGPAYHHPEPAR